MKKTAGILKFCYTVGLVLEVLVTVIIAITEVALLLSGNLSDHMSGEGGITVSGGTLTPAELDSFKPVVLIALGFAIVSLVFTILSILKAKKALAECKEERPFSEKSVKAIKASANLEIIGGVISIISSIILAVMGSSLTVNGTPIGKSSTTLSLSFLFYALMKYMLYHVAEYGHSLETNPDRR